MIEAIPSAMTRPLSAAVLSLAGGGGFDLVLAGQQAPAGAQEAAGSGKNEPQERRRPERRGHELDPTSAAVTELASPGVPKATVAQARADGTSAAGGSPLAKASGSHGETATPSVAGDRSEPLNPKMQAAGSEAAAPKPQAAEELAARAEAPAAAGHKQDGESDQEEPGSQRVAVGMPAVQSGEGVHVEAAGDGAEVGGEAKAAGPSWVSRALGIAEKAVSGAGGRRGAAPQTRMVAEPDHEQFEAVLNKGLAAAIRQGGGSVTLRLQPAALGDLKIKMELEGGRLAAQFEVGTKQARELLDKTMDALRSALEARGLGVDRLDVRYAERTDHPQGHGAAPEDQGRFGDAGGAGGQGGGPGAQERGWAGMESPAEGAATLGAARMPTGRLAGLATEAQGEGLIARESMIESGGARVWIRLDAVA